MAGCDRMRPTLWQVASAATASLMRPDISLRVLARPVGIDDFRRPSVCSNVDAKRVATSSMASKPNTIVPMCSFFSSISVERQRLSICTTSLLMRSELKH